MSVREHGAAILAELTAVLASAEGTEDAAARILAADRVFFTGAERSGLMLRAWAMRLVQMGRTAYAAGDVSTPAIGRGDLLVAASASGSTASVLRHVRTALDAGADVCIITARRDSPLTALAPADVILPAQHKDAAGGLQPMGSLFEQGLLILGDAVVLAAAPDPAALRARHANLE